MRDHTKLRAFELADIAFASLGELHYRFCLSKRSGYFDEIKNRRDRKGVGGLDSFFAQS